MAGRKPKPTALKRLSGTDQPCRVNPDEPVFSKITKYPPYPAYLCANGKKIYKDVVRALNIQGMLNEVNVVMLVSYCHLLGLHYQAEEKLGDITNRIHELDGKSGAFSQIKALQNLSLKYLAEAKKIAVEFGLTPASAARVKAKPAEEQSELDKLLKG